MAEAEPPTSWAPWLWWLDIPADGAALDASALGGDLALELERHFARVHALADGPTVESTAEPALPSMAFDCIAIHETLSRGRRSAAEATRILTGLRRALRPGGYLVAASANPSYMRNWRERASGISPDAYADRLGRAGFRTVRRIYVDGSLDAPRALVPDARPAAIAYEASPTMRGNTRPARRLMVGLGLRRLVYHSYYVVAQA